MVEDEIKVGGLQQPSAQPCTEGERLLIIYSEGGVSVDNVRTLACTHRWSHGCVGCANHSAAPRTCCSQGEAKNNAPRHADVVEICCSPGPAVTCLSLLSHGFRNSHHYFLGPTFVSGVLGACGAGLRGQAAPRWPPSTAVSSQPRWLVRLLCAFNWFALCV